MPNGDDAAAAGLAVMDGSEDYRDGWDAINETRDMIATRTSTVTPVTKGGTGATTAAAARTNLGAAAATHTHAAADVTSGTLDAARIPNLAASKITSGVLSAARIPDISSLDSGSNSFGWTGSQWYTNRPVGIDNSCTISGGLTVSGGPFFPYARANPVVNDYVVAYLNVDGRLGATPSALSLKQDIAPHPYTLADALSIEVVDYRLRDAVDILGDDAATEVGVIADWLLRDGLTEYVVLDEQGAPLTVRYERLALVALGALHEVSARLSDLEARLSALEPKEETE